MATVEKKAASLLDSVLSKIGRTSDQLDPLVQKLIQFLGTNNNSRKVSVGAIALIAFYFMKGSKPKKNDEEEEIARISKKPRLTRKQLFAQLKPLIKIVLPGVKSKEFLLLSLHTLFLVSRTFLSIYVADLDGYIVKSLVDRNGREFLKAMGLWLGIAVPATYVNSMIKYLESKLSIAFRTRLSEHAYKLYMQNETYYRVSNLDSRLTNADQCLTEDISKFSAMLAHLHSQLSKPILDVVLFSWEIFFLRNKTRGSGSGFISGAIAFVAIWFSAKVLSFMQPPYGKLVAQQAKLEGDLRFAHSRLITSAEEVAFYGGHKVEESMLQNSYLSLVKHMNHIFRASILYNMLEGFFMKYIWSAAGLTMIAVPAFWFEKEKASTGKAELISNRTQDFITNKKLLLSGAEAIERIMLALKDVNELAGYTTRVAEMLTVFNDVSVGKYHKQVVKTESKEERKIDIQQRGVIIQEDYIKFEDVPIVSPNGDILIAKLSFEVHPGNHLLITGPNGCGKSSLFRILGGLWPVISGTLTKPEQKQIFYIPQRPYLAVGNLRDQVIYPDTVEDMHRKGFTDKDLEDIFGWVNLLHILERERGWDTVQEWKDVLSGGEKQRVAMARLFYHKPHYAILDECTSAVSIDVEGKMYQHAIDVGITLLTVTHRPTLWKYHNYLLQFDGEGGYKFTELNATVRLSLKEEKSKLESQLQGIPKMQQRLRELCRLLGEDSVVLPPPGDNEDLNEKKNVKDEEDSEPGAN